MKPTLEEVFNLIPEETDLYYISDENLNDRDDLMSMAIRENNLSILENHIETEYFDTTDNAVNDILNDIRIGLHKKYDSDIVLNFVNEYQSEIENEIFARDISDPLNDVLDNTLDLVITYDLGIDINENYSKNDIERIKNKLGIDISDHDDIIKMLLENASCEGKLLIFFNADVRDLISRGNEFKNIEFNIPTLAIVDYDNGMGFDKMIPIETVSFNFEREKIDLDLLHTYNYTCAISDMDNDWCKNTKIRLS